MVKISRRSDGGKSTNMSFKNVRYGSQKTVSKHLNAIYRRDTARFEMQPVKHGNFEQQIRNCAGIHALVTKKTSSFVSTRSFLC